MQEADLEYMLCALKPSVITCFQIPSEHVRGRKTTLPGAGRAGTGRTGSTTRQGPDPTHGHIPAAVGGIWGLVALRQLGTEQRHLQDGVGKECAESQTPARVGFAPQGSLWASALGVGGVRVSRGVSARSRALTAPPCIPYNGRGGDTIPRCLFPLSTEQAVMAEQR